MDRELSYRNHKSAAKYGRKLLIKAAAKVARGGSIAVPVIRAKEFVGLRISVRVVDKTEKLRVIHILTFSRAGVTAWEKRGTREPKATLETGCRPVNTDTDWRKVPVCRLAEVITENIRNIEAAFALEMDVKSSSRQVGAARNRQRPLRIG